MAFLPWSLTAIQLDFVQGQSILLADQDYPAGSNNDVVYQKTDVETQTFSINLRQAFTGNNSFIRPMVSLGWARRFTLNSGYTDYRDNTKWRGYQDFSTRPGIKTGSNSISNIFEISNF